MVWFRTLLRVTVKEHKIKLLHGPGAVFRPMGLSAVSPVTLVEVLSEAGGIATMAATT